MALAEKDIRHRIAATLRDDALREAIDAADRHNAAVATYREAAGVTVDDDEDQWRRLTGTDKRDLTPLTQQRMQELALYLWESNLLANRLIELPLAYLLAEGARLTAEDEVVQEWLDRFWHDPINQMDLKLTKKCRELALFGEQCYPAFVNSVSGQVRLGYLDPALIDQVITDPDNGEQKIGVVTKRNARGEYRKYRIIVNGPEAELFTDRTQQIREGFGDGECFYFAVNDFSNGRRGRSDLLAQVDWLDAYDQYLFGELERSGHMRAFIWDVMLKGATPEEVKKRASEISAPKPNSVRVHNDSEEWSAETPDLKAVDSAEGAKLFRNHILGGGTIPEHWFGGASDVNRATGDSMGEPTFKNFIMRQTYIGYMLETMGRYVIRQREIAESGGEPDLFDPVYAIHAQFPEMIARDTTKYAAALTQVTVAIAQVLDRGILTEQTALRIVENISGRLGVEFDAAEELAGARAEAEKRAEKDVFQTPPGDPGDPNPAGDAPPIPPTPPAGNKQMTEALFAEIREAIEDLDARIMQPAPTINVTAPAPVVNVTLPGRHVEKNIVYDKDGNIAKITEQEGAA